MNGTATEKRAFAGSFVHRFDHAAPSKRAPNERARSRT